MNRVGQQNGYILLPVVLFITVIATIAFLINNDSSIDAGITAAEIAAEEGQQVTRAGLAHATWGAQNSGCAGDMAMTTVPFGQAGTDSYTATVTTPGGTTTAYTLLSDHDTYIRESIPGATSGSAVANKVDGTTADKQHSLYRFDLSTLPAGSQINSAVVWLYVTANDDQGSVSVHRVTADWEEATASWDNMNGNFDGAVLGMIPAQSENDVWVQVNLTAQVQAWVNGAEPNYGILLQAIFENNESRYASKEWGTASQRPRLEVVVGNGPASPVTIKATGTLAGNPSPANDISRMLERTAVPAYQPTSFLAMQPGPDGKDAMIHQWKPDWNYGANTSLYVRDWGSDSDYHSLLQFNLGRIPHGAKIYGAQLALYQNTTSTGGGSIGVHSITSGWGEGSGNGGIAAGVTWNDRNSGVAWSSPGGDLAAEAYASTTIPASVKDWFYWDITGLVAGWVKGTYPNHGMALVPESTNAHAQFLSSDATDPTLRPRLTIEYACECGSACLAPQGKGNVLMFVVNPTTLVPADAYKKALFESWGYTVEIISESANQSTIDAAVVNNDVVYVSNTVNSNTLGTRLAGVPIGVVTEEGDYNSDLGFATGSGYAVDSAIDVTDTSHYITAPFPAGPLAIYSAAMEGLTVAGTEAPGLYTLADRGGAGSLVVLDEGAMTAGGGSAAGRRVMLPLGRDSQFNWDYLNGSGRLIVQRALQWGTGNTGAPPPKNLLLVVVDPASLTAQEAEKKALIESWGYTVNLIDESDSQANFDAAIAANDVAYIPQDITSSNLGTKLANATIGVVNEEGEQVDELGFSADKLFKSWHEIDVVDNTHYITQPFAIGLLTFVSSDQSVHMLSGTLAPGLQTLAESFNTGSQWKPSLGTLDVGDTLSGGGTAAGRRVELPWGGGTFDINQLTDDGRTIMQRAIEWAEGAGSVPASAYNVLMIVGNLTLSAKDVGYKALIESWGHTVSLIDDGDSQANYDTAMDAADVILASGSAIGSSILDKPTNTTKGMVSEVPGKIDNFGFSSVTSNTANFDAFSVTDATHYITEPFGGNPVTVFTSSLTNPVPGGTLAPDLSNVAEVSGTLALGTLDTGATRYDSSPSTGRRVHLPYKIAETTDMTDDGKTILRRSLEWAASADVATTYAVLMVVSDPASLTPAAADRKALMESWGYTVNLIDDDDSAVNFDAGIAAADVVYVGSGSTPTTNVTKMLTDTTKGVVHEPVAMASITGFASSWTAAFAVDQLAIVDGTHSITQGLPDPATVFTSPMVPAVLSGTLAPDLQNLAEFLGAPALAVLEAGATTHDAQTTAGRRANLPFATAGAGELTADGQTIVRRAIEWAASGSGGGGGGGGGGGVVFEEFAEVNPSTTYNVNVPTPGGTVAGDLLIAAIASDEDASDLTAPAGWNTITVTKNGTRVTLGVWWKIAGASEPASHTFTSSSYNMKYGWMMRFSGHDPVSPINATSTFDTGSSRNPPVASATTTVADTLVLRVGGFDHQDITVDDPGLTGHTPITMDLGGSGLGACAGGAGYTYLPTAGATGTTSFALTGREEYVTGTIVIAPAP